MKRSSKNSENSPTDLEQAVYLGNLNKTKELIRSGHNIESKDDYGRTILYYAIKKGFNEIVELLCKSNTNVNNQDHEGKAPLHFACIYSQLKSAEFLIKYGAQIDLKDENGNTPLSDAIFYSQGKQELVRFLLENGADYNLTNNYGINPKDLAKSISNFDLSYLFK